MSSAFLEYFCAVRSGEIVACQKIKKLAERLLHDYDSPGQFHYDHNRADRAIGFIERFCHRPAGTPGLLKLELFQKAIVATLFGFVDDSGLRRFHEAMVVIARKNGKTTLCSAIELYMLLMDKEVAPQIYNVATKQEQAKLGFDAALNMVKQSPTLSENIEKRSFDMYASRNLGYIKALSSATKSLDGLDVHCAIIDELAAMTNRDIYDLVKQGTKSRRQPLVFTITTNGYVRENIFDSQYRYASDWLDGKIKDDRFVPFIFELDERSEWEDDSCWIKANPGLGALMTYDSLASDVNKAKQDSTFMPTVLTKTFNLFENSATAFLSWDEIDNEATFDIKKMNFKYAIAGLDLSSTTDLTSVVFLMRRRLENGEMDPNYYLTSMYWIPETVLDERTRKGTTTERDDVPYSQWVKRGLIRTCPGNRIDKKSVIAYLNEFQTETGINVFYLGYDPWGVESYLLDDLKAMLGKKNVIEVRQGYKTESPALKSLKAILQANQLVHNRNPIDMWCMRNAAVKVDDNGNIMLCKKDGKAGNRIDGFAALLDAFVVASDNLYDYEALL